VASFILTHSPLVGPATWQWVAEELTDRGHQVLTPAVPPEVASAGWSAFADAVGEQAGGCAHATLVGHSGAGPLLPQIAARLGGEVEALVFVDAGIPPDAGEAELMPEWLMAELRSIAEDGLLPPWSQWFGPDVMQQLVPDDRKRVAVAAELPRLPLSYFEDRVPAPAGWTPVPRGYVLLSEAYASDADSAEERGWPVARLAGAHLDIVTRPVLVTDAILRVSAALGT